VLNRLQLERWLFGAGQGRRRTQDSPILPDVWYAYALPPSELGQRRDQEPLLAPGPGTPASVGDAAEPCPAWEVDLLLRAHAESSASDLARALYARLDRPREETELAFNESYVACRLTFLELLRVALPLTDFWQTQLWPGHSGPLRELLGGRTAEIAALLETPRRVQGRQVVAEREEAPAEDPHALSGDLVWLIGVVGRIAWEHILGSEHQRPPSAEEVVDQALRAFGPVELGARSSPRGAQSGPRLLWTVNCNRRVRTAVWRSRVACKADAATHLFKTSCRAVRWAVIDSGVDARHPAFARRRGDGPLTRKAGEEAPEQSGASRVAGTWDFITLRKVLTELPLDDEPGSAPDGDLTLEDPGEDEAWRVASWVARGRAVDWELIAPRLQITHDTSYCKPEDDHGTHVAGILMGDWRSEDCPSAGPHDIQGMCTDMTIYDLRTFDEEGRSDEFQVLSAMQFVRYLNAHDDLPVVHGVNLSFSIEHEVDTYAAGATPVCEEAHRLIASGVVVVAAAGNEGRDGYVTRAGVIEGYRSISITDPGNAEKVITVGSTHGERPHTYGVSYFSSRGPTGDGRAKPDLVAPGEKITSTVPGGALRTMDGTSQAAPHVSGACALLMARHPELVGQPERVKQIVCASCTDLGRERSFQRAGMVDVLRAIQAV
jgi:serine protease AprX